MSDTSLLKASVISQISLMQSFVAQLPNGDSMLKFVCSGFSDLPGTSEVAYQLGDKNIGKTSTCFEIKHQQHYFATIIFKLNDSDAFSIYTPYIENFCNMLGVIFNNERQKQIDANQYRLLFENTEVSIIHQDWLVFIQELNKLRSSGIKDIEFFFKENPDQLTYLKTVIRVKNLNEATLSLFEAQSKQEFIDHYSSFYTQDNNTFFTNIIKHIWEKRKSFRAEIKLNTIKGRQFTAIISFQTPENSEIFGNMPITIVDIEELKQAEKKQITQQRKLRMIIDNIPSFLFIKNEKGEFLDINVSAAQSLGKTPDQVIGKTHYELAENKEQAQKLTDSDLSVIKNNKSSLITEEEYISEQGEKIWLQTTKIPCPEEIFGEKAMLGNAVNITSLKKTQQAMIKAKRFAEKIIDTANAIIVSLNKNAEIEIFNAFAEKCTGYSKKEVLNKNWFDIFIQNEEEKPVKEVFKKGFYDIDSVSTYVNQIQIKNGGQLLIRWSNSALFDENEKQVSILCIGIDISKQRQAEQNLLATNEELRVTTEALKESNQELLRALEEAQKSKELEIANKKIQNAYQEIKTKQEKLEQLNIELQKNHKETIALNEKLQKANTELFTKKEKLQKTISELKKTQAFLIQSEKMASVGILTAGIAHEINNPLNFIHGGNTAIKNIILDKIPEHSDELMPLIKMISTGIERTTAIVKSLNRFNRRSENQNERCSIHSIIDDCLVMLHNQIKHIITVEKVYSKGPCMLLGNEGKLHQVFLNLLANAVQAIEHSGTIKIITKETKSNIIVQIKDSGCGIKTENLNKIFDPFFTTKDPALGTGLGLSIAFNIIKEHQGRIFFKSTVGKGTLATIILPRTFSYVSPAN